MILIKLNKENPKIEFKLNSEDSYLLIHSAFVTSNFCVSTSKLPNKWTNFISKVKLTAELRYVVFDDQQGRLIDDRRKQFSIDLVTAPYQVEPVFQLNKFIKNGTLTLGTNPERKFYQTLKLELQDVDLINDDYTLELKIEKFKIDN